MPLSAARLGAALNEKLTLHSSLCRREASRFVAELTAGEPLVVACTQESRLFAELAEQNQFTAPLRFVNIRETGGWSRDAAQAGPKIAALLALAHLPEPEPVSTVRYQSCGRLLIIGAMDAACAAADLLSDVLDITLFTLGVGAQDVPQERRFPVLGPPLTI